MQPNLNDGAVSAQGIKVIVEDGLADHIQRQLREESLHVNAVARLCCRLQENMTGARSDVCPS